MLQWWRFLKKALALSVAIQSAIEKFPWYDQVELGLRLKLSLNATWSHLPYLIRGDKLPARDSTR